MKKETYCPECGSKTRYTPCGWTGDTPEISECPEHGCVPVVRRPVPCYICGGEPVHGYDTADISEAATGIHDWVPGVPSEINLCASPKCWAAMEKQIKTSVRAALDAGAYE